MRPDTVALFQGSAASSRAASAAAQLHLLSDLSNWDVTRALCSSHPKATPVATMQFIHLSLLKAVPKGTIWPLII